MAGRKKAPGRKSKRTETAGTFGTGKKTVASKKKKVRRSRRWTKGRREENGLQSTSRVVFGDIDTANISVELKPEIHQHGFTRSGRGLHQ